MDIRCDGECLRRLCCKLFSLPDVLCGMDFQLEPGPKPSAVSKVCSLAQRISQTHWLMLICIAIFALGAIVERGELGRLVKPASATGVNPPRFALCFHKLCIRTPDATKWRCNAGGGLTHDRRWTTQSGFGIVDVPCIASALAGWCYEGPRM